MKYIALLRGINVGGQKKIKMIDLKNAFEGMSFKSVETYIQSGNVTFESDSNDATKLSLEIEKKINERFGFEVKVIIRSEDELRNIVKNNPFIKQSDIEIDKLYITFMVGIPDPKMALHLEVKKEENEKFEIFSREIYLYCPNGYGRTKLNNVMFERKLKTVATTRNWKTINAILGMI
jgi:uncharacterized protein (DUF1697 family)